MASFPRRSSSGGRPTLKRLDARNNYEYEPTDSPRSPFLALDSEDSLVFNGNDQYDIERLCQKLGIAEGVDGLGISISDWEASKNDRRSRSLTLEEKPSYDIASTSSASYTRSLDEEDLKFRSKPQYRYASVRTRDSRLRDHRQYEPKEDVKIGKSDLNAQQQVQNDSFGTLSVPSVTKQLPEKLTEDANKKQSDIPKVDHFPIRHIERVKSSPEIETTKQLLPPPPILRPPPLVRIRGKDPPTTLSTLELLASFGPDERANSYNSREPSSDSDESVDDVSENELEEETDANYKYESDQEEQNDSEETISRMNSIHISSWKKLEILGSGSFGTVYEAMSEDGMYFAVKEVSLSQNDTRAQQCVAQLEQEIKVLSRFQHENIVRYLGTHKEPATLYIFLELVSKGSLASAIRKYELFDSQIRLYTRQILNGLKYLHDHGIVHRDIKCANILVDVNGTVKVADFGLARQVSELDELNSCKGSAYWMAPEVIDPSKTYSFPADIWSLGCTVLEMETRRPPFCDLEWHRVLWKVGHGERPPIPENLPEAASDFIQSCLEVNPNRRPTAEQLLEHPFVRNVNVNGITPRKSLP